MPALDFSDASRFLVLREALDAYSQRQHAEGRAHRRNTAMDAETRERMAAAADMRRGIAEQMLGDLVTARIDARTEVTSG